MSISPRPGAASAAVVARAGEELATLEGRLWAAAGDEDLLGGVAEIARLRARAAALEAEMLVEIDSRGLAKSHRQWGSTTDWLAFTAGLTRGQAKRTLRHAHELSGERSATWAALRAGEVSPAQADVVCAGIDDLPGDRGLRQRAEAVLLQEATRLDATDLARAARRVMDQLDPDHEDRKLEARLEAEERAAHAGRFLWISDDGAGGVRLRGRGSLEDGAVLRAALLPLSRPEPARPAEAAQSAQSPLPAVGRVNDAATDEGECELRDLRDSGARAWDALVRLGQHALDTQLPETSHATVPRVSVTIPVADLLAGVAAARRGIRTAECDDGLFLHPAVVRRMACDAEIIPVTLGGEGQVLDVGRAHRNVTPAIWRALVTRDRHCAFPGCRRRH